MKIRRFLSVFLLTLLLTGLFCVPQASAVEMPQVNAKAALLMDYESGRMLYGLNEKDTEYPASITKVMTCLLYTSCPNFMDLEVTETEPGLAGNTATNTLKPATVETGAEVKVPLFINIGDKITIDTRTGEYLGRAK